MDVSYRQSVSADLQQLLYLLEDLFSIEEDFSFSPERALRGLQLLQDSSHGTIIIAEEDEQIAGMVSGQLTISTAEGGYSLLIEDLIVHPDIRGNGVGRTLLEKIADWAVKHGASRMQLLADCNNADGLNFYMHNEWQRTHLICLRKYHRIN